MRQTKNVLTNWITSVGGAETAARKLGVHGGTVRRWIRKEAMPSAIVIERITKVTRGRITVSGIVRSIQQ